MKRDYKIRSLLVRSVNNARIGRIKNDPNFAVLGDRVYSGTKDDIAIWVARDVSWRLVKPANLADLRAMGI